MVKAFALLGLRRHGRRGRLVAFVVCLCGVGAFLAPSSMAATVVASDLMLPHWQGASKGPNSTPAVGHEIDCSSTNPFWDNTGGACTISIYTVTTGQNCYDELIANPLSGAGGENLFRNTQCQIQISGEVDPQDAPGTADCSYQVLPSVTWASGVNSVVFSDNNGYSLTASMTEIKTTTMYHLTIVGRPLSGPLQLGGHQLVMKDQFIVNFNDNRCPGNTQNGAVTNSKANVYDPAVDTDLGGSAGFFQDNVAVLS